MNDSLSDVERAMLDFERGWWKFAGAKEQAIRERFDISAVRYYQRLNALIDKPAALAYQPTVVRRLQLQRQRRPRRVS